jgi:hypothetical protein
MWPRAAYWWMERSTRRTAPAPLPFAWLCWSLRAILVDCSCPDGSVDCVQRVTRPLGKCCSRSLPARWAVRWRRRHSTWGTDVCFADFITCTEFMKTFTEYLRDRRVLWILYYLHWAYEKGHTIPEEQTSFVICIELMKTDTQYLRDRHSWLSALSLWKPTHSTWGTDILCYLHWAYENRHTVPEGQTFFVICIELKKTDTQYLRDRHSLLSALSLRKRTHSTWRTDACFAFFVTFTELMKMATQYLRDRRVFALFIIALRFVCSN